MSSEHGNVLTGPFVVVRVALPLGNEVAYRFIDQFGGEPYTYVSTSVSPGDLQVAGKTTDTTAIAATFPKGEWVGFTVEGDAEMMTDD